MTGRLDETDWKILLKRIQAGKCTPFLGAGVNNGVLPLGREIAESWAKDFSYPLEDCHDLVRVAQFLAVRDPMFPKEQVLDLLKAKLGEWEEKGRDLSVYFNSRDNPLGLLADLPISVYMTTNYDDLLVRALRDRKKEPQRELCHWNKYIPKEKMSSIFDREPIFEPTPDKPIVFHLHGHDEVPESLVIAEDDYLEFLVNVSRDMSKEKSSKKKLLPDAIAEAMASTSLLFIGYGLADWSFRVLWRLIRFVDSTARRISVAVQLPPSDPEKEDQSLDTQKVTEYLNKYFKNMDVLVYWGKCTDFAAELRDRWSKFVNE